MHILGLLLSAIVFAGVWYFRFRRAQQVVSDVSDAVGRARANYRLAQRRKDALVSPVRSIDDPVLGAAVLMVALLETEGALSRDQDELIADKLADVTGVDQSETYVTYAKWACEKVPELSTIIRLLLPLWKSNLQGDEARQLHDMAKSVCLETGGLNGEQDDALARLKDGLQLS